MVNRSILLVVLCRLAFGGPHAVGEDIDAIRTKVDKARAGYEAEVKKLRVDVLKWLDKQEEAARRSGKKTMVDQVRRDRQALEKDVDFPAALPKVLQTRLTFASQQLEGAYDRAIKEYTRAKRDAEAAKFEEQLKAFRNRSIQSKIVGDWRWGSSNVMSFTAVGTVTETGPSGQVVTRGIWKLERDRTIQVNLANGYSNTVKLQPPDGAVSIEVRAPNGQKSMMTGSKIERSSPATNGA